MKELLRNRVVAALAKLGIESAEVVIEHPGEIAHGDYATGAALRFAKQLNLSPKITAESIVANLGTIAGIERVEIAGPGFINFHLSKEAVAASMETARSEDMWGANATLAGKKIMVEYTDPNPFKEFHIGHLMSNAIGESIARLLQFSGAEVKRANYQGDVGPHVAKTIWAIRTGVVAAGKWGEAYVAGNAAYESNEEAKKEIDAINAQVYDRSDGAINALYDSGRAVSLAHFEELYTMLGTKFDHYFFESATAPRGLEVVRANAGVFEESDGAIVYKGEKAGLHTRVFITSRGLPTYETKDLGLALMKTEAWDFDHSITITANEQKEYFAVVVAAMREIMPEIAAKIRHITHGMMRFAEGKMSSRTGNVITGESLLQDLAEAAKARAAESRADDAEKLAQDVAVAAVKYQVLKQVAGKDIVFDRERALSLEGDSGPYLQYAHARTHAIVEKAQESGVVAQAEPTDADVPRLLRRFPEIVAYASEMREPHLLTTYLTALAASFNSWYAQEQILDGTPAAAHKVAITDAVRKTLKNGLWILGIPAPERM
jgi:arginyl-tRNA synthetase